MAGRPGGHQPDETAQVAIAATSTHGHCRSLMGHKEPPAKRTCPASSCKKARRTGEGGPPENEGGQRHERRGKT